MTDFRHKVAEFIEMTLKRHGVKQSDCEGTLDDAEEIIASMIEQANIAIENERLEEPQDETDAAYENALDDAKRAILNLADQTIE